MIWYQTKSLEEMGYLAIFEVLQLLVLHFSTQSSQHDWAMLQLAFQTQYCMQLLLFWGYELWGFHWKISGDVGNQVQPNADFVLLENHLESVGIQAGVLFLAKVTE